MAGAMMEKKWSSQVIREMLSCSSDIVSMAVLHLAKNATHFCCSCLEKESSKAQQQGESEVSQMRALGSHLHHDGWRQFN
jgi:hypothetical protein